MSASDVRAFWKSVGIPVESGAPSTDTCFRLGDIAIRLERNQALADIPFKSQLDTFRSRSNLSEDADVVITHIHAMPPPEMIDTGRIVYNTPPWIISHRDGIWFYQCVAAHERNPFQLTVFAENYTRAVVFHRKTENEPEIWSSLAMLPTDQIWLSHVLADRHGLLWHASGVVINGMALVFAGRSGSGKSTIIKLLSRALDTHRMQILCDDRIIVRKRGATWHAYGTWSHGEIETVSAASARLRGVLLLDQANMNRVVALTDTGMILRELLKVLIKPYATTDWWGSQLDTLSRLIDEVEVHRMEFDLSGDIVDHLMALTA